MAILEHSAKFTACWSTSLLQYSALKLVGSSLEHQQPTTSRKSHHKASEKLLHWFDLANTFRQLGIVPAMHGEKYAKHTVSTGNDEMPQLVIHHLHRLAEQMFRIDVLQKGLRYFHHPNSPIHKEKKVSRRTEQM